MAAALAPAAAWGGVWNPPVTPDSGTATNLATPATNPALRPLAPGVFELGRVRIEKTNRTVRLPAVLNMNAGLLEYLLVNASGKTHESLLRTEVAPVQIHLALLLLGAQGAGTNAFPEDRSLPLPGDPLTIELVWSAGGQEKRLRAEDTILTRQTRAPASRGPWTYTGSRLIQGLFLAQETGSIVSLIEDPDALINNPRPGRQSDELWEAKPEGLPPLDSPVEVIIKLERAPAPPSALESAGPAAPAPGFQVSGPNFQTDRNRQPANLQPATNSHPSP